MWASRPTLAWTVLGRLGIAGLLGLVLLAAFVHAGVITVPDRLNPFAQLRVADEPNWLTVSS